MKKSSMFATTYLAINTLLAQGVGSVELHFDRNEVVASELTKGGSAAFFSVSRETLPWSVRVVPRQELMRDDDVDGRITFRPENGVAKASVWAAVDLDTGDFAVGGPDGSSVREVAFDGARGLRRNPSGVLKRVSHNFESLELLVVRPGVGAWRHAASEGGTRDHGPPNDGELEIDLEDSVPVGDMEGLFDELQGKDVLIGIDPRALRFFAVRFVSGSER